MYKHSYAFFILDLLFFLSTWGVSYTLLGMTLPEVSDNEPLGLVPHLQNCFIESFFLSIRGLHGTWQFKVAMCIQQNFSKCCKWVTFHNLVVSCFTYCFTMYGTESSYLHQTLAGTVTHNYVHTCLEPLLNSQCHFKFCGCGYTYTWKIILLRLKSNYDWD